MQYATPDSDDDKNNFLFSTQIVKNETRKWCIHYTLDNKIEQAVLSREYWAM